MSATITSSLGTTHVTSFRWAGGAENAAYSYRTKTGEAALYNWSGSPRAAGSAGQLALWQMSGPSEAVPSTTPSRIARRVTQSVAGVPYAFTGSADRDYRAGDVVTVSAYLRSPVAPPAGFVGIAPHVIKTPGGVGNVYYDRTVTPWTAGWQRLSATMILPEDLPKSSPLDVAVLPSARLNGAFEATPAGFVYEVADVMMSTPGDGLREYVDGGLAGSSVLVPDTTAPLLVLGYETARRSQNVYHDVLGGGQDITLRPAALRTGTLRLLYSDEEQARAAVEMHTREALFYFEDPDRRIATMYYATDGDLRLTLDESRQLWTLDVSYREVQP